MKDFGQESDAPIVIHVASLTNSRDKRSDNVQIIVQEISRFIDEPKDVWGRNLDTPCRTRLGSMLNYIRVVCRKIASSERVQISSSGCFGWLSKAMGSRFRKYVVMLVALTAVMSTASSLFMDIGFSDWSMDDLILLRSYQSLADILVWSSENYDNLTIQIIYTTGSEQTFSTTLLGVFRVITDFCETFQNLCFVDIWLVISMLIWGLANEFNFSENTVQPDFEKHWAHYKKLRRISEMLEECMGGFLKQIHMNNLFLCTYFLLKCMEGDYDLEFWLMGVSIIKTFCAYYVAAAAVEMVSKDNNK
ncbi:unnamed protein product [Orchesella dallaii]|uniref:Gustatory receptor n=1 Tax=Orchesella dallaii TaxID=48710 RepID=A0ABP1QZZ4_9HEXA